MVFYQNEVLAEALWEEENLHIEKRFNTTLEELSKKVTNATNNQQIALYENWISKHPIKVYQILKTLGLKPMANSLSEQMIGKRSTEQLVILRDNGIQTFQEARNQGVVFPRGII